MTYKGQEGSWVAVKILDSRGNLEYIDQGTIVNGICEFKTLLSTPDKYYLTMNGSSGRIELDPFEIK